MDTRDYEVEDLLLDKSFQNYCLGTNEEDVLFWKAWMNFHPEKKDMIRQAMELYTILNGNHSAAGIEEDRERFKVALSEHDIFAGQSLLLPVQTDERQTLALPRKKGLVKKILVLAASAAAILLAVLFFPAQMGGDAGQSVGLQHNLVEKSSVGERKSFQLPDGSKVMLNSASTIQVSKNFNETTRELTLSGEAFFDVASNPEKPFIIHTASMDVKVLGTIFNVKAYDEETTTETSLLHGSVEITLHSEDKKILLKPNEKIVLANTNAIEARQEPVIAAPNMQQKSPDFQILPLVYKRDSMPAEVSWTENLLVFTDNDFATIAKVLERWYNITIKFADEEIKEYRFTANFDQKNITQVLEALQLSRGFTFRIAENNNIIISK